MDYEFEICKLFKLLISLCKSIKNDPILDDKLTELNIVINTGNYKTFIQKFTAEVISFSNDHLTLILQEDEKILSKLNFPHSDLIRENYPLISTAQKNKIWKIIKEIIKNYANLHKSLSKN